MTIDQSELQLEDIDLLNKDVFAERVPHDWFQYLRHHAPVYHHAEPAGPGFWVFTSHEDITALNRDWQTFSSEERRGGVVMIEEPSAEQKAQMEAMGDMARMMLMMDPPDHTRYRKLVNRGFTPRVIRQLEEHMRDITTKILDTVEQRGGECDFVVEAAAELPLEAIAEFLGVPSEDRHKLFDWSNRMIGSDDAEYQVSEEAVQGAQIEMFLYAQALGEDRRSNPRKDIVSDLIHAEIDGDQLTESDFLLFFMLLAVAGNETTRNAIAHGMHALLENPDQYQMLVDDPELIDGAVEEILRWATPVMMFRRNVTHDLDFKGNLLKAGDKVTLWYISANRDETVFDDPYTFDITRTPNNHIAFGGGGPHFCLGANLARMEIKVLFEELTKRFPRAEMLAEPDRLRSNFINGIKHLDVKLAK